MASYLNNPLNGRHFKKPHLACTADQRWRGEFKKRRQRNRRSVLRGVVNVVNVVLSVPWAKLRRENAATNMAFVQRSENQRQEIGSRQKVCSRDVNFCVVQLIFILDLLSWKQQCFRSKIEHRFLCSYTKENTAIRSLWFFDNLPTCTLRVLYSTSFAC